MLNLFGRCSNTSRCVGGRSLLQAYGASFRGYSSKPRFESKKKKEPRIRYLFYMFLLSSATIYVGGKQVDKRRIKKSFGSEKELDEYEQSTGIKRRTRLILGDNVEKYKFYALPYTKDDKLVEVVAKKLGDTKTKVLDPSELVEKEIGDETRRYSFLLQDLKKKNKPVPPGLVTAILKQEIGFYLNTSQGIYDTNFLLKNYPQDTQEASKFETDIAELEKVVVFKDDILALGVDEGRNITNVVSYFETVGKSEILESEN